MGTATKRKAGKQRRAPAAPTRPVTVVCDAPTGHRHVIRLISRDAAAVRIAQVEARAADPTRGLGCPGPHRIEEMP
jgi:hypothetical protein